MANKTVIIKKSRWGAPTTAEGDSALYESRSKRMCCLGFCAKDAGYTTKEIRDVSFPYALNDESIVNDVDSRKFLKMFPQLTKSVQQKLATVNDDFNKSREQRAEEITALGRTVGINFQFVP